LSARGPGSRGDEVGERHHSSAEAIHSSGAATPEIFSGASLTRLEERESQVMADMPV
jgi:hypothetical protein